MPSPPSRWTLRTTLIASVLALFMVVMLGTGALTVLETRRYLTDQLEADLVSAVSRVEDTRDVLATGQQRPRPGREDAPGGLPGQDSPLLVLGLTPSGAVADDQRGTPLNSIVDDGGLDEPLTTEEMSRIDSTVQAGRETGRVSLGDRGSYLVTTRPLAGGGRLHVGVSTQPVDRLLARLLGVVVAGTAVGLVMVGLGGSVLIRRTLAPLDRVAGTARRVSRLKLDSGEVALAERVPDDLADERTEVGQVGQALNTMLDNVESALTARQESETRVRQFVADASHELRTPLASIRGYAELTRREHQPVPPTVTHAISRVEAEALRMQVLVEDLLLLARLDAGRPLVREPVDLSLLAMNAVSDAHAASPDHGWQLDLPDEPVEVTGDAARLHQVLANLLANARTHTPPGTRVVTSLRTEGEWVRLSVSDDGPGVPASLQPVVFERFTRGDDSRTRATGSTGLGLSIVAAVGQAHGGSVEVSSTPGLATFSVILPAG